MKRLLCIALVLSACGSEEPPPPMPDPASATLDGAGNRPVHGSLGGEDFTVADARFRAYEHESRRRVDILLADEELDRCGLRIERPETTVAWLRFGGRATLEPGDYALGGENDDFSAHYERPDERSFVDAHRAVGNVRIERAEPLVIAGKLRVCFADRSESCIGGTFEARPCVSRIDGHAIREPPGLDDEAIEAWNGRGPTGATEQGSER